MRTNIWIEQCGRVQYQLKNQIYLHLKLTLWKWTSENDFIYIGIEKKNILRNIFNKRNARLKNWKHKMSLKKLKNI